MTATLTCPGCGREIHPNPQWCQRCGAHFNALAPPKRCPSCKSRYWATPRGQLRRGRPPKQVALTNEAWLSEVMRERSSANMPDCGRPAPQAPRSRKRGRPRKAQPQQ